LLPDALEGYSPAVTRLVRLSLAVVVIGLALASGASEARAQRHHRIKQGQTIAQIAQKYHVTVQAILSANRLDRSDVIRPGDELRIPRRGVLYVEPGQTLSEIAKAQGVSVRQLVQANDLDRGDTVRAGQRLLLPGHEAAEEAERAARRWGRPEYPGVATLITYTPQRKVRVRLVDRRGRPRRAAQRRLANLMRDEESRRTRRPPRRLVWLLAKVSDHFGGRPIALVSGYRPAGGYTKPTSRHTKGRALDIQVLGVPNRVVRDYVRKFDKVGVGYYPRSTFVHMDVRREDEYWVDWSRPGEAPQYRPPGAGPPPDEQGEASAVAAKQGGSQGEGNKAKKAETASSGEDSGQASADASTDGDSSSATVAQGGASADRATPQAAEGKPDKGQTPDEGEPSEPIAEGQPSGEPAPEG
jgi:uncharacterized protein YcbK (DUF882 family)